MVVILAVTHFEVFEHQLLAGWAPEVVQRIAITVALACAAAVVGSRTRGRPRCQHLDRAAGSRPSNESVCAASLGACAAALAVATFVGVGRASAHAELLSSDPQPGEVLDSSPAHITLTFNEPVEITLGGSSAVRRNGNARSTSARRAIPMVVAKRSRSTFLTLANGSYVVDWRVVSSRLAPPPRGVHVPDRAGVELWPPDCSIRSSAAVTRVGRRASG